LKKVPRVKDRGLWRDKTHIPPWEWRKGQRVASISQLRGEDFSCGSKRYRKEMKSFAEAKFYLGECGLNRLDGNKDGVPCEAICR
jgi:hypothetical protein